MADDELQPFSGFFVMADGADPVAGRWSFLGRHGDFPEWEMRFVAVRTPRGPEVAELTIRPISDPPPGGLQTRLLRAISLERLYRLAAELPAVTAEDIDDPNVNAWSVRRRPGKPGKPDRDFAVWAARYVNALATSSRPVADLAAEYHLSQSQIRNLIHACRLRGLLTSSAPGRAGGELTAKAKRELRKGGRN